MSKKTVKSGSRSALAKPAPRAARRVSLYDYPMFYIGHIHQANFVAMQEALAVEQATPHDWRVLASLQEEDGQTMGQLAARTVTERTYLSKIVAGLEQAGYLRRAADESDGRISRIFITTSGLARFRRIFPIAHRQMENSMRGLSASQRRKLIDLLKQMSMNFVDVRKRYPL